MKPNYLENVKETFKFLFDITGTIIKEEFYDPVHFGNWFVIILVKHILVKIVNDRGVVTVDLKPFIEPTEWLDLRILINFLIGEDIRYVFPSGNINDQFFLERLTYLAEVLKQYWSQLSNFLEINNYREAEQGYRNYQKIFVSVQLGIKAE